MRKLLLILLFSLALVVLWLWRGRDLSLLIDHLYLVETSSHSIKNIVYDGNGTGGILHADGIDLSLNETELAAPPNIGTTPQNELAVSFSGQVFPLGPSSGAEDKLAAAVPAEDQAKVTIQHSPLAWPNFFEINFMTGNSPKWKRRIYQRLTWKKPNGAKLDMLWRYEQFYYAQDRWTDALMMRPGSTGLIRVEISNAPR